jgi:GT2 family glycosyltransferase
MDIVVVNYRTYRDLYRFLDSVNRYPPLLPSTLTVVDVEAPTHEEHFPWAGGQGRWVCTEDNIGYGRACNMAGAEGTADIIGLFNADVEVTSGSLKACASALAGHTDWSILGPCQIDSENRIRHAGIFGTLSSPAHRGWGEINRGQYTDVCDAVTVSGSAFFVKRRAWNELTQCPVHRSVAPGERGAFLPTPHYYEETWATYHAQAHGMRVIYFGSTTLVHRWHQASPIGGWADQQMPVSRKMFQSACDEHGIAHD